MKETVLEFLITVGVSVLLCGVWAVSKLTVADDCETTGHFHFAKKVYECKLKEVK